MHKRIYDKTAVDDLVLLTDISEDGIVANLQAHKNKMGKEYSEKDDDDVYELVREMLESERPPRAWYIVMPDTRLKMMWDLLILLLVFVSAFSIPAASINGLLR